MPNDCYNRWVIETRSAGEAQEVFDLMTRDRAGTRVVTFTRLKPMPGVFEAMQTGGCRIDGEYVRVWFVDTLEDGTEVDRLPTPEEQAALDATGSKRWSDWAREHWGTKWDAYQCERAELDGTRVSLAFYTAWGPPRPIVDALRERYGDRDGFAVLAHWNEPGGDAAGY